MLQIYCPQCGASVDNVHEQRMATCPVCRSQVPVPKGYTELESGFAYAMEARMRRDFVAAEKAYGEILKQHADSAAAYWGRALSRYAVEYQPLGGTDYRLVCHQAELTDFGEDADVEAALKYSTGGEQMYYLTEIEKISRLQREVARYAAMTEPYQVLIVADGANGRAMEQVQKIQRGLRAAGLRSFCPALELQGAPRDKWEPQLYRAFSTAMTMVYVAVGAGAFPAELQFDAERYLSLQAQSQRKAAARIQQLIVAYEELDEYSDIPDAIFDGAETRLYMGEGSYVDELCELASGAQGGFGGGMGKSPVQENFEYANLIAQASQSLQAGKREEARKQYEKILAYNPKENQAYWGLMLIEFGVSGEQELIQKGSQIRDNANYKAAIAFATEREQQHYAGVAEQAYAQAQVLQRQAQERRARAEQLAREREEANEEVSRQSRKVQEKEKKRSGALTKAAAIVMILAVVGGIGGYIIYANTLGKKVKAYEAAMELYNDKEYVKAADAFLALEDYKDSEKMYEQSLTSYNEAQYQEGLTLRKKGDYKGARDIFDSLDNYRDSTRLYEEMADLYRRQRFDEAVEQASDLSLRATSIATLQELLPYLPQGQEYLEQWKQEGIDYYNQGRKAEAAYALVGFGLETQEYVNLWREGIQSHSQTSASGYADRTGGSANSDISWYYASIEDSLLVTSGYESGNFVFEYDTPSRAVAIGQDGLTAVLREDGTVYITGFLVLRAHPEMVDYLDNLFYANNKIWFPGETPVPSTGDIAGWKNITQIWIDGIEIYGLGSDGKLRSMSQGIIAKNVAYAQLVSGEYIGVDTSGKVFCTVDGVAKAVSDWTGIQDIYLTYDKETGVYEVKAIDESNRLLYYHSEGKTANYPTENLLRVYYDRVATLDGTRYDADGNATTENGAMSAMISYYTLPAAEETTE